MNNNLPIKILIAEDHALVRQGMVQLLKTIGGFTNVLEAPDGEQMLAQVAIYRPDVVLLDLAMPVLSGIDAFPVLRRDFPEVKVIIVSMNTNLQYVKSLMEKGASGFLPKDADISEVLQAIKTAMSGRNHINKLVKDAQTNWHSHDEPDNKLNNKIELSDFEKKLICLIVAEKTSNQIASELAKSKASISLYRRTLLKKLGVKNAAGLTQYAIYHGIC